MSSVFLVVMAGGSGTRFWPKSTSRRPKQLLSFTGEGEPSLLQSTLLRFEKIVPTTQQMIVTTELLGSAVSENAPQVKVLREPQGRNTAPCVFWAAMEVFAADPDGIMLVMPSDHFIRDQESFRKSIHRAIDWASKHSDLVTLGVKPDRPETGYGYLELGTEIQSGFHRVSRFVEKPGIEKAQEFFSGQKHLWNGGMFVWKARVILDAFDRFMPEMRKIWEKGHGSIEKVYPELTALSIDYGIMEKAQNVVTFTLDCGWDDLGSWTSVETLARALGSKVPGGVCVDGEIFSIDSQDNIVDAAGKWVALLGVENLIISIQSGSVLIADKSRAQDIKQVVEAAKKFRPDLV